MTITNGVNGTNGVPTVSETLHNVLVDIQSQQGRLTENLSTIKQLVENPLTKGVVDDREFVLRLVAIQWSR